MKRAFNYTNRHRIPKSSVTLVVREDGGDSVFDLELDLQELPSDIPHDARVYVEAYRDRSYRRFTWGTVAAPSPAPDRRLTELGFGTAVLFRVKVVDESGAKGRILASIDRLSAEVEGEVQRDSLLPVAYLDGMGEVVWRVRIDGDSAILELNRAIPGIRELALAPAFAALVYPSVLRQVLVHLLVVEHQHDPDDATPSARQWLHLANGLYHEPAPQPTGSDGYLLPDDWEQVSIWVEGVVDAFCRRLRLAAGYRRSIEAVQES